MNSNPTQNEILGLEQKYWVQALWSLLYLCAGYEVTLKFQRSDDNAERWIHKCKTAIDQCECTPD